MRTPPRRSGAALALTLAVLAPLATVSAAPANATGAAAQARPASTVAWQPCEAQPKADCASVSVPLDWDSPTGPKIAIAIARVKAADPAQRIGTLLVDPGGPGGSGVGYVQDTLDPKDPSFSAALHRRFDIVGFDPRGVGASREIRCAKDLVEAEVDLRPDSQAEYDAIVRHNRLLGNDCRRHNGRLLGHIDTASVVRDMDAIRAALGESKVSYYGVSYGTQIGQQYAELFGGRLRALVLDSNVDHSLDAREYLRTSDIDFEGATGAFAAWCDRTRECALHGRGAFKVWRALLARAKAGTLRDVATDTLVDTERLRSTTFGAMYSPSHAKRGWFGLATTLRHWADATARPVNPPQDEKPGDGLESNTYQPIWCSDWRWRQADDYRSLRRAMAYGARFAPRTEGSLYYSDITTCAGWPVRVSNPQHRLSVKDGPARILVTASAFDPPTPRGWSLNVARQLPGSVFLTYEGVGHGDYYLSPCAQQAIDRYLISLATPAPGTRCPAVWPTAGTTSRTGPPALGYPFDAVTRGPGRVG